MTGDDRDELLARIDLTELWAELVGPRGRGGCWPCPSPDHAQTGASPPVSIDTGKGLWCCHGCGVGGSAVDLLCLRGFDLADAFVELRRQAGMPARPATAPLRRRSGKSAAPPRPLPPAAAEAALATYVHGRGWRREVTDRFGLHAVRDRWGRARIRYPFRIAGDCDWRQDRAIGDDQMPRWLAPPGEVAKPIPYAVDLADAVAHACATRAAVVVEGPSDAIGLAHAYGPNGIFAVPGGACPPASWVWVLADLTVAVIVDADDAGERLRAKLNAALVEVGARVIDVRPPSGVVDLDDWRRSVDCDDTRFRAEVDAALATAATGVRS